jgi:hypothetical protein
VEFESWGLTDEKVFMFKRSQFFDDIIVPDEKGQGQPTCQREWKKYKKEE